MDFYWNLNISQKDLAGQPTIQESCQNYTKMKQKIDSPIEIHEFRPVQSLSRSLALFATPTGAGSQLRQAPVHRHLPPHITQTHASALGWSSPSVIKTMWWTPIILPQKLLIWNKTGKTLCGTIYKVINEYFLINMRAVKKQFSKKNKVLQWC